MNAAAITAWDRVSRLAPCPVCRGKSWCTVAPDGSLVRCKREESQRPVTGDDGIAWLHRLGESGLAMHRGPLPLSPTRSELDVLVRHYMGQITDERLEAFAAALGVLPKVLTMLGLGWTGRVWAFPMVDSERRFIGIRYRAPHTAAKWSERGGREGLFAPLSGPIEGPILLPEGATDAAALLGLDFDVAGRPSCAGGIRHAIAVGRGRDCVVVADRDPPGQRGAEALAAALLSVAASVRVVTPPAPHKDARAWVGSGARREDVERLIANAEPVQLLLQERTR